MTNTSLATENTNSSVTAAPSMTFLGHAGFDFRYDGVRLIVDPWLVGNAFDNGWELLFPPPAFDGEGVTHLWISHEHPDHFSPPSLRLLTAEQRAKITCILQRAEDARLAEFLRKQGFLAVLEVDETQPTDLKNSLGVKVGTITTLPWSMGDSCHLLTLGPIKVINTNDCLFENADQFQTALRRLGAEGQQIDLLASQFSYASWTGNPSDRTERRDYARRKLDGLLRQVKVAQPKYVFPCASYVVFAHEENLYLNDEINDVGRVCAAIEATGSIPILIENGSTRSLDAEGFASMHTDVPAISRKVADEIDRVRGGARPALRSEPVPPAELLKQAIDGLRRLQDGTSKIDFAIMQRQLPRAAFELRDHNVTLIVDKLVNARLEPKGSVVGDVLIGSEALQYAFKNDFGFETLLVNGRFEKLHDDGAVPILKLTGQFGYLRRKESLVQAIFTRRLLNPARSIIGKFRPAKNA